MSDSLQSHGLQHARPPYSPPTPGVYLNSCPLNQCCHPTISSSVICFSSHLQSFPESGSFQMNQLFTSGGQSFYISPSNEHPGLISFRMDWLDLLTVQGYLKSLLQYHSLKASTLQHLAFFIIQLSSIYDYWKTTALIRQTFVCKAMSLLFNKLHRLVITFLPRNKHLLISWLQSPSAVILEPPKIKSVTFSTISPSICHEVMGPDANIFWMLSFKPTFSLSSFNFIKRLFSSSSLSAIRVVSSAYLRLLIFLLAILIPVYASFSPEFLMMYSAYMLNKQSDKIQPWHTPFLSWFGTSLLFYTQF